MTKRRKPAATRPQGTQNARTKELIALLKQGLACHQAGDLAAAKSFYDRTLELDPNQPDALNLSGVAAFGLRQTDVAIRRLAASLSRRPDHADTHCNYANVLQAAGRLEEARHHFHEAIALNPKMALAQRNLGNLCRLMGDAAAAERAYRIALETAGEDPEVRCYLGDLLDERGEVDAAIACYRQALAARPDYQRAALNLAASLQTRGDLAAALEAAEKAVALDPQDARGHHTLGCILQASSRLGDAVEAYRRAIERDPGHEKALYSLGMVLQALDRPEEAAASYRQLLEVAPQHESARHMLDAVSGQTTAIAPATHIREIFDAYSGDFERHLVEVLRYDAPQALKRLVAKAAPQGTFRRALDLGCGTGLVARQFQELAEEIDGVDLSPKMVALARESGLYSEVEEADLLDFLARAQERARQYDLVLSADVFIYIGDLGPIFAALAEAMDPGALFALSVETLSEGDFALLPTGRYAQSEAYLRRLAATHGFSYRDREDFVLRKEWDRPISGQALLLVRDSSVG